LKSGVPVKTTFPPALTPVALQVGAVFARDEVHGAD